MASVAGPVKRIYLNFKTILLIVCIALLIPSLRVVASDLVTDVEAPTDPVILPDDVTVYPLGPHLDILEDRQGNWSIEDVTSPELSSQFIKNKVDIPNYGFTKSVYWVRVRIGFLQQEGHQFLLEVGYPLIDHIKFFVFTGDGRITTKESGDALPFSQREIVHQNFVFKLPSHERATLYLRFET